MLVLGVLEVVDGSHGVGLLLMPLWRLEHLHKTKRC